MSKYRAFELDDLQADRSASQAEFLRRTGISMGVYHLPTGGKDLQHPHASDEVYVVRAGRGTLEVEGERIGVGPGRMVSVDIGATHHSVDVTEDLPGLMLSAPAATPGE